MLQVNWTRRPSAPETRAGSTSLHRKLTHLSAITCLLLATSSSLQAQTPTYIAGTPAGQLGVSSGGAASYTIPISVPPGTAGMQPSLALSYNSQGGNGAMGMGWGLAGLSAVTRCPQTMASDGARAGINLDLSDRYCLGGQRLILVSGSEGVAGAQYRTEMESFSNITAYGSAGNGPAYFIQKTKDGLSIEYGNSTDSRIEAQGKTTARVWAQNKVSDNKGNYLTASYTEDNANGAYRLARIDYTGNANATPALSPSASVQWSYESRPDIETGYQAGSLIQSSQRITNIKTYSGATLVRDYRLSYEQSGHTQRSRLKTVIECDGANVCLQATSLAWPAVAVGMGSPLDVIPSYVDGSYLSTPTEEQKFTIADFNGDGKMDYMWLAPLVGGADPRWYIAYAAPSGFTTPVQVAQLAPVSRQPYSYLRYGDFNGDGKTDVLAWWSGGSWRLATPTPGHDTLTAITRGDGHSTSIVYKPITDGAIYSKDSGANAGVYPVQDIQAPFHVVASASSSNGIGGVNTTSYHYGGLKSEANTGRGMLGFRWVKSTDTSTGLERYTEYRQDYPYTGMAAKSETRLAGSGNGGVLKRSTSTAACHLPQTGAPCTLAPGKRYFPYVASQLEESWELNGTAYPSSTSTVSYTVFPHYGDPSQTSTTSTEGWSKTTALEYWPADTTNWIVGRLKQSTVTSVKP